jgi:hypothetical protein
MWAKLQELNHNLQTEAPKNGKTSFLQKSVRISTQLRLFEGFFCEIWQF